MEPCAPAFMNDRRAGRNRRGGAVTHVDAASYIQGSHLPSPAAEADPEAAPTRNARLRGGEGLCCKKRGLRGRVGAGERVDLEMG